MPFIVHTINEGPLRVEGDSCTRMGEFYAFFSEQKSGETKLNGFWRRLFTGVPATSTIRTLREYTQLVRLSEIRRIEMSDDTPQDDAHA